MNLSPRISSLLMLTFAMSLPVATAAEAESVFACTFDESAGLKWDSGTWKASAFPTKKSFFLRTLDGRLTEASINAMTRGNAVCNHYGAVYPLETCVSILGDAISFQSSNMVGAYLDFVGSSTSDKNFKEPVFVSPFSCQKI